MNITLRGGRGWIAPRRAARALFAVVLVVATLGTLGAGPARADTTFDQKMLELVNEKRAAAGVAPLQSSLVLDVIAGPGPYLGCGLPLGGRANDMGARNYFSHTILNCGNQSVFHILSSTVGLVYSAAAENIAWMNGTTDPLVAAERLTNDLMNSPSHRTNILDPRFTHVGIGSWRSAAGQSWTGAGYPLANVWIAAQVFGQMPLAAAPVASVTPTTVGFGERAIGTTSLQSITVKNTGSAAMSITGTSITGAQATDFSVATNNCGASLAAGASCAIAIHFTPKVAGSRSATLSLSTNASGTPHGVSLTGVGVAGLAAAPTNAEATGADGEVSVRWTPATTGPAPVGFGVFVYDATGYTGKSTWVCGTCTSARVTGLANGNQYHVGVYGYTEAGWGAVGLSNSTWVLAIPHAPADMKTAPGDGALRASWRSPTEPGTAIDGFGVFVYDGDGYVGKSAWACATCTSVDIPGLQNGRSYYAYVYAHNANGWGAGAPAPAVVVGSVGMPGGIKATGGGGELKASWTPGAANGSPIVGYGAFVHDANGYTGKSVWLCGGCTTATIAGLPTGKAYTVVVQGYNEFGWGVPATSNTVQM